MLAVCGRFKFLFLPGGNTGQLQQLPSPQHVYIDSEIPGRLDNLISLFRAQLNRFFFEFLRLFPSLLFH